MSVTNIKNESKLSFEAKRLSSLREISKKCSNNTSSIMSVFVDIDKRLYRLEKLVQPIYQTSGNLQTKQSDLNRTIQELKNVIGHYSVTKEVDDIIRSGPANQLGVYMQSLERLEQASQYFETNNRDSPEFLNVKTLYDLGFTSLEKEFKQTLQKYSCPMAPIALLDLINEDATSNVKNDKFDDLSLMCEWLCNRESKAVVIVYNELRSDYIYKSLRSFIDYYRTTNGCQTKITPKSDKEIETYLALATSFLKVATKEQDLLSSIFPPDFRVPIFDEMVQSSLSLICNEANNLILRVKKAVMKKDFKYVLGFFPVLKYHIQRRNNFDLLFVGCRSAILSKFLGLFIQFQQTIYSTLCEYTDYIRSDTDIKVPDDGTVHELTNNVMVFVEQLYGHLDVLATVVPLTEQPPNKGECDENKFSFAQYVAKLLTHLGNTLQRKSNSYLPNVELVYIFKLNNFHYMYRRLKESNLIPVINCFNDRVEHIYIALIDKAKQEYLERIAVSFPELDENDDRVKVVKEKFTNFNSRFKSFLQSNSGYAVPDPQVKFTLREECKRVILSRYIPFYNTHLNSDLIKNKKKYIKYSPEVLVQNIDGIFE